jgi:hypothetical protein
VSLAARFDFTGWDYLLLFSWPCIQGFDPVYIHSFPSITWQDKLHVQYFYTRLNLACEAQRVDMDPITTSTMMTVNI